METYAHMPSESPLPALGTEDHNLLVTVSDGETLLRRVACRVWLPRRLPGRSIVLLTFREPHPGLRPPLTLHGRITDLDGSVTAIRADEVWFSRVSSRSLGSSRYDTIIQGDPFDLRVVRRRKRDRHTPRTLHVVTSYLLSRCPAVAPQAIPQRSYTGDVAVETIASRHFTVASGVCLKFENHYQFEEREDGTLSYPQLVATHEHEMPASAFGVSRTHSLIAWICRDGRLADVQGVLLPMPARARSV